MRANAASSELVPERVSGFKSQSRRFLVSFKKNYKLPNVMISDILFQLTYEPVSCAELKAGAVEVIPHTIKLFTQPMRQIYSNRAKIEDVVSLS